ncbi:putative damage-inducible protein DinB [Actinokineospora baliensis]|uniref:mycothiol transferase n=1 Tax=Actinokineospora baliensis TaxID=547056 RepID=UPI001957A7F1|nr:DUF664 domain-containing protein [Actinokineospora baliensis]MBM7775956.1 putative damage-inducible protein DinB [Actinokineospora baliensis]
MTDTPWEPPLAGTEAEHLTGALDRLRTTFRWKADGLSADGLSTRIGASTLTIGTLLRHLAVVEDHIFTVRLTGTPWTGDPHWGFGPTDATPAEHYAQWDQAVARARTRLAAALADGGLDQLVHLSDGDGNHVSLRRLVCDLIEEYGRHAGHADLLREAIDGRVGEDPPPGWRAES